MVMSVLRSSGVRSVGRIFFSGSFLLCRRLGQVDQVNLPSSVRPKLKIAFTRPRSSIIVLRLLCSGFSPLSRRVPSVRRVTRCVRGG